MKEVLTRKTKENDGFGMLLRADCYAQGHRMIDEKVLQESTLDTLNHIAKVEGYLSLCSDLLRGRAARHDASKLQEPERSGYAGLTQALKGLHYGTPEHRAAFVPFKTIIAHHYEHNSHHPEHYDNGVDGMSLLDVIEMLCDWKAASERTGDEFATSIHLCVERFRIGKQLATILVNTATELGWMK